MFAASTFKDVIIRERESNSNKLVVLLFVKPSSPGAMDIIREFEYIHYNSKEYCSIYAVGYTDDFSKENDKAYTKIGSFINSDWYYSTEAFIEFKETLEDRLKWEYSGVNELIVLQNNPGCKDPLYFSNYVAIDINCGIREGYFDSFQRLMESLVRNAKDNVKKLDSSPKNCKRRLKVSAITKKTISECKRHSLSINRILRNKQFYHSCRSYS